MYVVSQVYLESPWGGPHHNCAQLNLVLASLCVYVCACSCIAIIIGWLSAIVCMSVTIVIAPTQINWTNKKIETVVDYVKRPTEG